jgi:hypothetical protein
MKKICVIPFYRTQYRNKIFDKNCEMNRDNILEPFIELKEYFIEKGYDMNTPDITSIKEAEYLVFFDFDVRLILKAAFYGKLGKSIYLQYEPPVVKRIHSCDSLKKVSGLFSKILTWNDDMVDNKKFFKFYPPMPNYNGVKAGAETEERKLLTAISGYKLSKEPNELYSKRIEAIKYFESRIPGQFDSYGVGWDNSQYPSYKGPIKNKNEVLSKYKFSICYENMNGINGLLSEKIFDCFYAKCIPIFWGAENVSEYIPELCYIDKRKYESYDQLYHYIKDMPQDEYAKRIEAIDNYLNSAEFSKFLPKEFAQSLYNLLFQDNDRMNMFRIVNSLLFLLFYKIKDRIKN